MKKSKKISDLIGSNHLQELSDKARQETAYDKKVRENLQKPTKVYINKKLALKEIKDEEKIMFVYDLLLCANYTDACKVIEEYDSFLFFRDFVIFLSFKIKSEKKRTEIFRGLMDFYYDQLTIGINDETTKENI